MKARFLWALVWLAALAPLAHAQAEADPAEVAIGERLFLETRFAQFFAANAGDVNQGLPGGGDPVVEETETTGEPLTGPFAGQAINCRSCHLVDEQLAIGPLGLPDFSVGGMRTYADFARRSPLPFRLEDGHTHTARNSPALVNASVKHKGGSMFHFDGEFASLRALVRETLLGRNYGWLPSERKQAIAHIARVVRNDDGAGELALEFGGSYRRVLGGTDDRIPAELALPRKFRVDVLKASDAAIVEGVARLIARYVEQLEFATDSTGAFTGSPYDLFLLRNNLPRKPRPGEPPVHYTRRLRAAVDDLSAPRFVADVDGPFAFHDHPFVFDAEELAGLRSFLREPGGGGGGVGNCAACHPAPFFTDFSFHDTGVTQTEYDRVHGGGAFAALAIPSRSERVADPEAFLPPTPKHPLGTGRFRAAADPGNPELADLGAWNVLFNADFPKAQAPLRRAIVRANGAKLATDALLDAAIARFKTPGLRDLGHSNPYMHNGAFDTLEDVVSFYVQVSAQQRAGSLRNGDPRLAGIQIAGADVEPLAAFLRSLNEDYE
jgi:cytochrome c peroxidase